MVVVPFTSFAQTPSNLWTIRGSSSGLANKTPFAVGENGFWLIDALIAYIPPNARQGHDGQNHVFLPGLGCFRMFKGDKTSIDEDLDRKHFQNETETSQTLESIPLFLRRLGVDVIHR